VSTEASVAALVIDRLDTDDIPRGMELVASAGWNQTADDWAMMLRLGQGWGIRSPDGRLLATSVLLPYPPAIGWIGMVLVDPVMRRQGLATRLLNNAMTALSHWGLVPMLDATQAGREIYKRLGFSEVATITRWRGEGRVSNRVDETLGWFDAERAAQMEATAVGASRAPLLASLEARPGALCLSLPDGSAYLWSRAGRTAHEIGPVVSRTAEGATALCAAALDRLAGAVVIDVPDREASLADLLTARGFSRERSFYRMTLGSTAHLGLGSELRVTAGPELG
jgi:GNAT superfamily N-acetyltransferase